MYRNTPTGVGKTTSQNHWGICRKKHPHGRGEDAALYQSYLHDTETPPRAWGRLIGRGGGTRLGGNTPTGVGKTLPRNSRIAEKRKHPHWRGEDFYAGILQPAGEETPPRAWGRRPEYLGGFSTRRNTPTGVGKTFMLVSYTSRRGKHPHGRGEDRRSSTSRW